MLEQVLQEAGQAAARGDWNRAEAILKKAMARNNAPPVLAFQLGKILFMQGKMAPAVNSFRKAAKGAPKNPEAWFELGRALTAIDRVAEAQEAFERVIALAPKHLESHRFAARTARAAGDWSAAATHFRAIRKLAPQDSEGWLDGYAACLEARDAEADALRAQLMQDPAGRNACLEITVRSSAGRIPLG